MKLGKIYNTFLAAAFSGAIATTMVFVPDVEARTYTKSKWFNKDKCYVVKKVPALVEYDTMGELVRDESRTWIGNMRKHGSKVRDAHQAAVYKATSKVLEDQHYTLISTSC